MTYFHRLNHRFLNIFASYLTTDRIFGVFIRWNKPYFEISIPPIYPSLGFALYTRLRLLSPSAFVSRLRLASAAGREVG